MKTKNLTWGIAVIAVSLSLHSCSKSDDGSISEADLSLAQDEVYADALYEEVDNMVAAELISLDENGYSSLGLKSTEDDICRTVTVDHPDSTSFPKVITIDYGDGCTMIFRDDTLTRKGQVIITLTNRWFIPGAEHIVTFNEFYINDVKIEGTKTVTNLGLNDENHFEMSIVLEGGKITFNDTAFMTREANHLREWIFASNPQNDTVLVTGTATGLNVLGDTYSRVIVEPLVLVHCDATRWRWVIVDGLVEITNSSSGTTTIDYTADGCDGTLIVNKNGYRHNYQFRFHHRNHRHNH
jgi:hypothetical protein